MENERKSIDKTLRLTAESQGFLPMVMTIKIKSKTLNFTTISIYDRHERS